MFAVGVDVSNGRSMVAVLGARRSVVVQPHEVPHTADGFAELAARLHALNGEVTSCFLGFFFVTGFSVMSQLSGHAALTFGKFGLLKNARISRIFRPELD